MTKFVWKDVKFQIFDHVARWATRLAMYCQKQKLALRPPKGLTSAQAVALRVYYERQLRKPREERSAWTSRGERDREVRRSRYQ